MPEVKVVDISHHNTIHDFQAMYDAGVRGVIHKATQGLEYVDPMMSKRKQAVLDAGLLWGCYHFATGDDPEAQVEHFIQTVSPDATTLMALDHEPNNNNQLDLDGAKSFLQALETKLGRKGVLYSGNLIKEQLDDSDGDDYLSQHRLWLAEYGPKAKLPPGWTNYFIWQFSETGKLPGTDGKLDLNTFDGGDDDLVKQWP